MCLARVLRTSKGYELPDKGYFEAGKLPRFDTEFFNMPTGRAEDHLMDELQEKVQSTGSAEEKDAAWREYRERLENTLNRQTSVVDMGMDLGVWERLRPNRIYRMKRIELA